jgi:protease I
VSIHLYWKFIFILFYFAPLSFGNILWTVTFLLSRARNFRWYAKEVEVVGMQQNLKGKRVAILATDGFEQVELTEPKKALEQAGATTEVLSPKSGEIRGWKFKEWGDSVRVDKTLDKAKPADYDALVLPGGVANPDNLRMDEKAVQFVKQFAQSGKPVAAICHGPWTLIEAGVVKGHTLTSWPSLKTDLKNAGANWVDKEVVLDGNFITSRKPDDLPAFNQKVIEEIADGKHLKAAS